MVHGQYFQEQFGLLTNIMMERIIKSQYTIKRLLYMPIFTIQ